MPCFAQALDLKDDPAGIEAYKAYHQAVWPEVVAGLRAIGITTMRIFLLGTHLFMYVEAEEGFEPARDFQKFTSHPEFGARGRAWDELMRRFQQRVPEAGAGEWWAPMEKVFDLDWSGAQSS